MKNRAIALGLVLAALLACKTKSEKEVYAEAKPAADVLRAKVVAAAAVVEKEAPPDSASVCSSKKPLTFAPASDTHNTDYIMLEEAKRGAAAREDTGKDEDLDLHFNSPLPRLLRGTNGFYASYLLKDTAPAGLEDTLRRGKNVSNLVLIRSRGTSIDYFLFDLATPESVVCKGTFYASADPNLGTRTDNYDLVTKDKRSGKEISRESKSVQHDDRKSALYDDAMKKLRARMKAELQLDVQD